MGVTWSLRGGFTDLELTFRDFYHRKRVDEAKMMCTLFQMSVCFFYLERKTQKQKMFIYMIVIILIGIFY